MEERVEHEGKGGGFGHKGKQQETRGHWRPVAHIPRPCRIRKRERWRKVGQQCSEEKEEIVKLLRGWQDRETSPIVRWALADESTEEEINQEEVREESGEEKKETRGMRWADCEDDEGKDKEEQEKEKETRQETDQEELTNEEPPGLEEREEASRRHMREESRTQEAHEEERRAQNALPY